MRAKPWSAAAIEAPQLAGKLVIIGSNSPHPNDDEREGTRLAGELVRAVGAPGALKHQLFGLSGPLDDAPLFPKGTANFHLSCERLEKRGNCGRHLRQAAWP